MASDTLSNLTKDVQLAEQRFVRGECALEALTPYDRALVDHVDSLEPWDRPSGGTDAGRTIARARSRDSDRAIRPAHARRSFIPGAPDAPSLRRR